MFDGADPRIAVREHRGETGINHAIEARRNVDAEIGAAEHDPMVHRRRPERQARRGALCSPTPTQPIGAFSVCWAAIRGSRRVIRLSTERHGRSHPSCLRPDSLVKACCLQCSAGQSMIVSEYFPANPLIRCGHCAARRTGAAGRPGCRARPLLRRSGAPRRAALRARAPAAPARRAPALVPAGGGARGAGAGGTPR